MQVKCLTALFCILTLFTGILSGCGSQNQDPDELSGVISAVGSTALLPLVEEAGKQFMSNHKKVLLTVQGGGSGTGLSQVASGAAHIGNSDIFAEEKAGIDPEKLVDFKVCVVGTAIVINPGVTVDNLTKKQLIDIFTGEITNWKEVGGPDQNIVVINRAKGSGTRATFKKCALGGNEEAVGGMEMDSSGQVKKTVNETPGAISYLSMSYVDNTVKSVSLDGAGATMENICNGAYPIWAYEHMYTLGEPDRHVRAFLEYVLSDEVQSDLVLELGYIPITKMNVVRDAGGNIMKRQTSK